MKRYIATVFTVLAALFPLLAADSSDGPALKDVFKNDFLIGAAINAKQAASTDAEDCEVKLIEKHFNSISPENVLKWESIHPRRDRYNFEPADRYVEFGVKNHMFIIGHNLIWHNQTPNWVFEDDSGNPEDRDTLLQRMHDHISTVVGRYKGKIKGWDVVNEAVDDDGTLRKSRWLKIIGEDYLVKAYQFAHEADPDAELYYNEYSIENTPKGNGAVELVKKLQAADIPLAAVGIQGHYRLDWPSTSDISQTIDRFSQLGVKVNITELDVDVLPAASRTVSADVSQRFEARAELNPYPNGLPELMQQALARRYADLFSEFMRHRSQMTRVTFWGVTDTGSWLNSWPVRGRTDYPMLFDRQCQPKPAFDAVVAVAQGKTPAIDASMPSPMSWTANEDHQNMMDQLGIKTLRSGANGNNRQATNYQNTDESKANPYPNLPDPLILKSGEKVTTPEMWWNQRHPEIVEDFDREVYGRVPANVPKVHWNVTKTTMETNGTVPVVVKQLSGRVDNSSYPLLSVDIQLTLTTPANATGPVPVMMEFGFGSFPGFGGRGFGGTNRAGATNRFRFGPPAWQSEVLAKGWGYAVIVPTSYQADNGAGLTKGIIGLCNKGQPRKPDDWGALRAWAWGASRAVDYFETDSAVDAKQVGIEGLSRYGKATIVTMAYDPRFAIALVGSSGEGGAKLSRRNYGELVENLTGSGEYHWMAGNFLKYGGPLTPGDLPVDAHELIALCAPRPTFISYGANSGPGAEGTWVDQHGSFMAAVAAGPVFKLLGKKDLGTSADYLTAEMPAINTSLVDGDLAWREHDGGHTDAPNWPMFLKWADRYIKSPAPAAKTE